jgi:hypothetical protein
MSLDAYKVAVKIALVENVTAGLASMSKHFATANLGAKELNAQLKSIGQTAMLGGGLVAIGGLGLHLMKGPLEEAKKYQNQMAKLQAQGVGDAALIQADKYSKAQRIIGASSTDTLKMLSEANSVLRDMHHAEEVTPMLLKMKFGIESVMSQGGHGGGHGEKAERMFMDALKVGELRGALIDQSTGKFSAEKFKDTMDFMTRAYTASGGLVKPTEYLNMIKTGGIAAKSLSDQAFYFGLMHMAQEQGGSRTGTGLMSAFQNMYMGRTTQQVAEEMNKMGLLQKDKLHYGKTGHLAKIDAGSLKDADLFRTDQFRYMNEVMLPQLRAKGIQDGEAMKMEIAKLFSNRVGGSQWVTMYQERANIQKHIDAAKNALGVDELAKLGATTLSGKEVDYEAKLASLKLELGQKILPLAVRSLELLIRVIDRVTQFSQSYPVLTKFIVQAFAIVSVLAVLGGSLLLFKSALMGLSLLNPVALGLRAVAMAAGPLAIGGVAVAPVLLGLGALVAAVAGLSYVLPKIFGDGIHDKDHPGQHFERHGRGANNGVWVYDDATKKNDAVKQDHAGQHFVRAGRGGTWVNNKPSAGGGGQKTIQVKTELNVDGRKLAEAVSQHQAREASRPGTGAPTYDPSMGPVPVGLN